MRSSVVTGIVGVLLLGGTAAFMFNQLITLLPCARPIGYSIGPVDPRFGITQDAFETAIREAAKLWEDPAGKPLFSQKGQGGMVISAIYDYRQEAAQQMKDLGIRVDEGKKSYDLLVQKHASLESLLQKQTAQYKAKVAAYETQKAAYEAALAKGEAEGFGAEDFDGLERQRVVVNTLVDQIAPLQKQVNQTTEQFNAVVTVLNKMGNETNTAIDAYNTVGDSLHDEFDAGLYTRNLSGEKIEIFAFEDTPELKRLLTHELGHALGLEHVTDSGSIMYRLNRSQNTALSQVDIASLKERCNL